MMKALVVAAATCSTAMAAVTEHSTNGHRVMLSDNKKNHRKWMTFPDQKSMHQTQQRGANLRTDVREEKIVRLDEQFWAKHTDVLKLTAGSEMLLQRSFDGVGADVTHHRYDQTIHGLRVFGGEFIVTVGAHGGVMRLNGLPITQEVDVNVMRNTRISEEKAVEALEQYISGRMDRKEFPIHGSSKVELSGPMELGWHNSLFAVAKEGTISLAYFVSGVVGSKSAQPVSFDAFVSAHSGAVLQFFDKSQKGETSPFSSPINNATIMVYDQYKKDLNDDVADDYYSPDPDKYSNLTLVFDTETGLGYPYPTSDYEMNELIDNTLYVKYMYYSLSNGEYLTWNLTETTLNIEYNLTIANAFFDGVWGIHFGSGYITDDVVPHEWSHGYTQTGNGLIYAYESGAMNEAFSDIYGESVDILNHDTTDPDVHRTIWPTTCHQTLNSPYGIPPGDDWGTRWSMGENVTTTYPNGDGSIRDMYKPECFFQPSTTDAPYYSCTTYADSGGVHKNSGVMNRLYAVLTDGGEYTNPANPDEQLEIYGLGFTKATNLFWRTHQVLTPTSQYMDMANSLMEVCEDNIGATLYFPNLFNYTIMDTNETLTEADCINVANAVAGSGMDSDADFCPNIACDKNDIYDCRWKNCSDSDESLFYEDYDYYMGYNGQGMMTAVCDFEQQFSSYARVFEQDDDDLSVSCIQFGYFMNGQTQVVLSLYMDEDGGDPDMNMTLLGSMTVETINAVGQFQVQTASFDEPIDVIFENENATLVVVLTTPYMEEGYIIAGGTPNPDVVDTIGDTYVGGGCAPGFTAYYDYTRLLNLTNQESNQWFVKLSAEELDGDSSSGSDGGDDDLTDGEVAGVVIGTLAGAAILGVGGYFVYTNFIAAGSSTKAPLLSNQL